MKPKFKVGETVYNNGNAYEVHSVNEDHRFGHSYICDPVARDLSYQAESPTFPEDMLEAEKQHIVSKDTQENKNMLTSIVIGAIFVIIIIIAMLR